VTFNSSNNSAISVSVLLHSSDVLMRPVVSDIGGRKGIQPVKELERWGAGTFICSEQGADLHMAQLMRMSLTVCSFSMIQAMLVIPVINQDSDETGGNRDEPPIEQLSHI